MAVRRGDFTTDQRAHLMRAVERYGGSVQAVLVLYAEHNPVLVRFAPLGYQDTNYQKLAAWLRDQSAVNQSGLVLPGASAIKRLTNQTYQLSVMCPPETRVVPISYRLDQMWTPFIERYEGTLTYVRVNVPPTMWTLPMRWTPTGDPAYDLSGTAVVAIGRTRFRHFGMGNANAGDGGICWGTRLATVSGVASLKAVQDLYYGSPFNTDLQQARFLWNPMRLPHILERMLNRNPDLTIIPARCFAGRGLRVLGTPQTYMQRHIEGRV